MAYILIAEDDNHIRETLTDLLESECYDVTAVENGDEAMKAYNERKPDLLLLDVMMAKKSGYDVCREIRGRDAKTPIIMLTAKSEEFDKVLGLSLGADDYITKPFGIKELLARVAAVLRRARAVNEAMTVHGNDEPVLGRFGSRLVDYRRYVVVDSRKRKTDLSAREVSVLKYFIEHPNDVVSRDFLITTFWGLSSNISTRGVDQFISRLRKKLGDDAKLIESVQGTGYKYSAQD